MAMIMCPECNNGVSDKARKCPNCGVIIKDNKKMLKIGALIFTVLVAVICIFSFIFEISKPRELKYAEQCIEVLNNYLYAPDSLDVREVWFYDSIRNDLSYSEKQTANSMLETGGGYPIIIIKYSAQIGYGGKSFEFAVFSKLGSDGYNLMGIANSIDPSNPLTTDQEKITTTNIISMIMENLESDITIDVDKLN